MAHRDPASAPRPRPVDDHRMRVSGCTILRHAGPLGYPFIASIRSLLPLVDELIAVVADDDDTTTATLQALGDDRIRVIRTRWNTTGLGGVELSRQTNIALSHCTGDWAIYLQADEVIHEADHEVIRRAMRDHLSDSTEGLSFNYLHFFRSYNWVADDWQAFYPTAVRIIRTGIGVESAGDAAGFARRRFGAARGVIKAATGARIFHYGWAGPAADRLERAHRMRPLYSGAPSTLTLAEVFAEEPRLPLRRFQGSHPAPMRELVSAADETFTPAVVNVAPAWLRAWREALREPASFRGLAGHLLPVFLTNLRWRVVDLVRARRRQTDEARRATFYRAFMAPNDLVFDVGANVGARSRVFRATGARVVAFEPQSSAARALEAAFAGDRDFTLVTAAVSDTEGPRELHLSQSHPLATLSTEWIQRTGESGRFPNAWAGVETVDCTTLDRAIAAYGVPAFIKIDVEGHEWHVVRGLSRAVNGLSLEFAAESIDQIGRCVDHLESLARYEYRLALGDAPAFTSNDWVSADAIKAAMHRARDHDRLVWGDVYARRAR